ncbi:uncharacterized protein [Arachis hypogaea]|uniref:uncharacterized protein n=1 Tax=Arachis hypogaea TaxID=3818 RepID=UPI003B21AC01
MNSHPFGYESGYNYVAGKGNYNENRHQGWNNQRWEEPQGFDQPSWQQPPPKDYQQPPPYAYKPSPQHDFGPPYSQAPFHHSPSYDPNPHPPYQPPYEPNEPYIDPPQPPLDNNTLISNIIGLTSTLQNLISRMNQPSISNIQSSSSSVLPFQPHNDLFIPSLPSMEEHPHPSIQEQDDPNYAIDMEQERRNHLRESILHKELEEALRVKVGETLEDEGVVERSCHGKKIIEDEYDFILKQLDKATIIKKEDVVADLRDAVPPLESPVTEPPSKTVAFDVEEGVQPPRHIIVEDLEEVGQEMEIKEEEAQPPMPLVNNEEEIELEESYQEEEVDIEETCKEVEVVREEHKGVEPANLLEILPLKLPSSFTTFKWVKFISLNFLIPLEYGLLETDGQLRALCGIKRKMVSGKNCPARFIMVGSFKFKCKGWCKPQLNGSRKLFGSFSENSTAEPPGWNHNDQQKDGCKSKVWDPGIQSSNQHSWGLVTCFNLLESFLCLVWDPGGHWNHKHWWRFLDEFKHKPP